MKAIKFGFSVFQYKIYFLKNYQYVSDSCMPLSMRLIYLKSIFNHSTSVRVISFTVTVWVLSRCIPFLYIKDIIRIFFWINFFTQSCGVVMLLLCSWFLYFDQLYIATQSPKMTWTSLSQFVACNKHIFEHSYISSHFSEIPSQWQFHRYPQSHMFPWLHNFFSWMFQSLWAWLLIMQKLVQPWKKLSASLAGPAGQMFSHLHVVQNILRMVSLSSSYSQLSHVNWSS